MYTGEEVKGMRLYIEEWFWDEDNLTHLGHGLTRRIVEQVSREKPRFRSNKKGKATSHQMIGPDRGQGMWTVCIVEMSYQPGVWLAITGWPSEQPEIEWYRRNSR